MNKDIGKRIDKLNSKIVKTNEKLEKYYSKSIEKANKKYVITSIGVGALPILSDAVNIVLSNKPINGSDICMEISVGVMTYYYIYESLEEISNHMVRNRENKVREYINELHGYAIEDNKEYQKSIKK